MEVFALNFVEKTSENEWEKLALKIFQIFYLQKQWQDPQFIGCQKLAVGICQNCRSTGPVDRQRSKIRPLESPVDRRVDRAIGAESKTLCRSTGPVGRDFQRVELSGAVDRPVGRPPVHKGVHVCARRSTEPVDRLQN